MKMKSVIFLAMALLLVLSSCVHRNFEEPEVAAPAAVVEVGLQLNYFDIDMPLHTVVDYGTQQRSSENTESPLSRHIIKVYDSRSVEVCSKVITDNAANFTMERNHRLTLAPGEYTAVCWTDYATELGADMHYDTSNFPTVELRCAAGADGFLNHQANTPRRDAFCGSRHFRVGNDGTVTYADAPGPKSSVLIEMRRPMARFIFEATDVDEFASRHGISPLAAGAAADADASRVLSGFNVTFRYSDYMPSVFSAQTDAPVDSRVGASFSGVPKSASSGSGAIELGSDFVFVHPLETSVSVAVEVCKKSSGEVVARSGPFTVPLLRNKLTIVRGRFLTSSAGAGIIIDVGFEGDFNIKI